MGIWKFMHIWKFLHIWKVMHIHKFFICLIYIIKTQPPHLEQQWKFKTSISPNVELYYLIQFIFFLKYG